MDTANVILLLKNKDEKGLSVLYDQYAPALNGIIFRIVKSEVVAEEVLQQTFLKVWNNIDSYDENKSSLFTWMSRIARNAAIDRYRLKSFNQQKKTESLDAAVYKSSEDGIDTSKLDVEKVLKEVDEKYKQVLFSVYLQGNTHKEAAKQLGIPEGTIKTRLRFAIKELRHKLKEEKHFLFGFILLLTLLFIVSL